MNWAPLLEAIRTAVARAGRLPDGASPRGGTFQRVAWRGTPKAARTARSPWVDLRRVSTVTVGRDELRHDYLAPGYDPAHPDNDALVPVRVGNRRVRIQCLVTTRSSEAAEDAESVAETIRDRFLLPSVREPLVAAGVGFHSVGATVPYHWIDADDREVSEVAFEIVFNVAVTEREDAADVAVPGGWIAEVHGEGELEAGLYGLAILPSLDAGPVAGSPPADPDATLYDDLDGVVEQG